MKNILIEIILTNQCNKRCEYCDLDFSNNGLSYNDLDKFIIFLENNPANYTLNFFGGEPLLAYDKLKYLVTKTRKLIKKFTIGTNGLLLDNEKITFLKDNDFFIYLSVDNISKGKDIDLNFLRRYNDIININFINDPNYLDVSLDVFDNIKKNGFKNISFMPVYSTKKRNISDLGKLNYLYKNIFLQNNINLNSFCYFNGVSSDIQFILDTNGYFYSDIDSLLWLQKQYKVVEKSLYEKIESETKLLSIHDKDIDLYKLLKLYNIKSLLKLIFDIPKFNGDLVSYKIIDKILKK